MSSETPTNTNKNSGTSSNNSSVPAIQRPPNMTDALAQAFAQINQLNSSQLSGSQLYGLSPKPETVNVADSVYTIASITSPITRTLTVDAINQGDTPLSGYVVNIYDQTGNTLLYTGTTPYNVTLNKGQTYVVEPGDFSPCYFSNWNDNLSAARYRSVTITANTTLTAAYTCSGGTGGGPTSVGIILPLYVYPSGSSSWAATVAAAANYPNIPILIIVNPGNGPISLTSPQTGADPNWTTMLTNFLKYPNVTMIGYIDSAYGSKAAGSGSTVYTGSNTDTIRTEANSYNAWYSSFIKGFFIDDVGESPWTASYATNIASALNAAIPGSYIVGNPGASLTGLPSPAAQYIGVFNNWCVFEDDETIATFSANDVTSTAATGAPGYAASNFSYITYGYPSWTTAMANNLVNSMADVVWLNFGGGSSPGSAGGSPYAFDGQSTSYLTNMLSTLAANGG